MKELLSLKVENNDCDFERIDRLRNKMQKRLASICSQRALLYTTSFKQSETDPYIVRKAKAFAYTLRNMDIYIEEDSLIFGNMASRNFAAPIYPEYSIDWIVEELDTFEKRKGDIFVISEDTKKDILSIQEYWHGRTHEDYVKAHMSKEIQLAQQQKVLHCGGISMSGDGHIVPNYELILSIGLGGIINVAQEKLSACEDDKKAFYQSVILCNQASLDFIKRYGGLAKKLATKTKSKRKAEYLKMACMCETLLVGGAEHFYECVESVYLLHILQMIESNGHSFCYGRFDQYAYPYYKKDVDDGLISQEKGIEILTHMFIMNNSCNKVRSYGHTKYSQGYPLYSNLMIGGFNTSDEDGTNALSYLCMEAMHQCSLSEPNFSMRYHEKTPRPLLEDAARLIRTQCGMPSMFNDEVIVKAMGNLGIPHHDAVDYCAIGCVEVGIQGKYGHRATGMTYVNWGKLLELLMNNGVDPKTQIQLVSIDGSKQTQVAYQNYESVWNAWEKLLKYYSNLGVECDHICDASLVEYDADPFASSLVDNALEIGRTLKAGGAKYDFVSQSNIGVCVVGNGLAALKYLVFDKHLLTLKQIKKAIDANWEGQENKKIQAMIRKVPKFGNDNDYVDNIVRDVFESYLELLPSYHTNCENKGPLLSGYTMSTSNITSYIPNGLDVGASIDGRDAYSPLNEGCSPTQGSDTSGPTALITSVSKLPNERVGGGQLLNMRFSKEALEGNNFDHFVNFLIASCKLKIFHNQFNVIDSETLRNAQREPAKYSDLIVRVAGYCAQFVSLMRETQEAIIERTQHHF